MFESKASDFLILVQTIATAHARFKSNDKYWFCKVKKSFLCLYFYKRNTL